MMLSLRYTLEACMGDCRDRMSLQATEAICRLLFCLRDVLKNTDTEIARLVLIPSSIASVRHLTKALILAHVEPMAS